MTRATREKLIVVLKLTGGVPDTLRLARGVVAGMTGNHDLPAPNPSLPTLSAQIDALDLAEVAVRTGLHSAVPDRDARHVALVSSLKLEKAYVQGVVDANPERGAAIAVSAGMAIQAKGTRIKPDFAVKHGALSGSAVLEARSAGAKAIYDWELSTDQKTWTALPQTLVAKTTVTGLTAPQTYAFRYRVRTAKGLSDWSQIVTLTVV